jgi:YidC/Oxa1 family membrane protein insertase
VLLVVYVGSMLASTYFMSATMDPRQKNMRYVFYAMTFVFIPFVVRFPIGLVLYWSTTNLWTVGQGLATRRLLPRPQPPPKRTSRTPPKEEVEPAPAATAADGGSKPAGGSGQQRVRRRKKKKGPRARR